uniref:ZP domain-containing protein n=1 Tax=Loa loa TaxID=7209 RepID=A0A1I7VDI0_LOALO
MPAKVRSAVGAYSALNDNNQGSSRNDAQIGLGIAIKEIGIFDDEEIRSADQSTRPVPCPKEPFKMPAYVGYAEVISIGKQLNNVQRISQELDSKYHCGKADTNDNLIALPGKCISDDQIAEEKQLWGLLNGCIAIAALFFLGKLYVANTVTVKRY